MHLPTISFLSKNDHTYELYLILLAYNYNIQWKLFGMWKLLVAGDYEYVKRNTHNLITDFIPLQIGE